MAASAGSFSHLTDEDFILDRRVVGGMQQVSLLQAQQLGGDVILNSPVRSIDWEENADGGTRVRVISDRATVNARYVIMAVPPNLYSRVSFNPPLPRRQHQMHQHQSLGLVIKVHAVYGTPFWRENGLSGTCFGADAWCRRSTTTPTTAIPAGRWWASSQTKRPTPCSS
ncbi:putrescine oxidase [Arthrobacter sp. Hiyo6]|nr:putrescine oxidase [Arthrobacter sp. Hiyo6]